MEQNSHNFFVGTSGLVLPVPNKLHYPKEFQEGSRLTYYGALMSSIEINSSFYKLPQAVTVAKWAQEVPQSFKFTFKLYREITHQKELAFNVDELKKFIAVINAVGEKRGCLLVQFPPSIKINHIQQLHKLLSALRLTDPRGLWKIAVEFRHFSLYTIEIYDLLEQYKMTLVIHDKTAGSNTMLPQSSDFVYLRFHGPNGNYKGTYTEDVLAEYASYINEWIIEGKKVYTYFNNTMGQAFANAITLEKMVNLY